MRSFVLSLLAAIMVVACCSATTKVMIRDQAVGKRMTATYDRFAEKTTVMSRRQQLYGAESPFRRTGVELGVMFDCPGDSLTRPDTVWVFFLYTGEDWRFLQTYARRLTFLLDQERIQVPVLGHDGQVCSGYVTESMLAPIRTDLLLQLFTGGAQGQLGSTEFTFSHPKTAEFLREIAEILSELPGRRD